MTTVLAVLAALVVILMAVTAIGAALIARRFPPPGFFVPVTGGRLHVRDIGPRDAPPERTVLLLHGASGNHLDLLEPLRPLLEAEGFRIIAIDRPGLGWSERVGGSAAADAACQAAVICQALDALKVPRCLVLGYSLSGAVATALAMDHPERVAGLALLCPVTHPWPGGIDWRYKVASLPVLGPLFVWTLVLPTGLLVMRQSVKSVFLPQVPPDDYITRTATPLILRPWSFRANALDVAALHAHVSRRAGRYGELRMPVTVISGEADTTVWAAIHTAGLAREVPDIRVSLLPGVGHMPHHHDPAMIAGEMATLGERAKACGTGGKGAEASAPSA